MVKQEGSPDFGTEAEHKGVGSSGSKFESKREMQVQNTQESSKEECAAAGREREVDSPMHQPGL